MNRISWIFVFYIFCPNQVKSGKCRLVRVRNKRDPVNYWSFNGNLNDATGYSHLYGLVNGQFTEDRFGNKNSAMNFSKGYAIAPEGVYFYGEYTIMVWVKLNSPDVSWSRIIDFANGMNLQHVTFTLAFRKSTTPYQFVRQSGVNNGMKFNNSLKVDVWAHLAVTKSRTEFRAYFNGIFESKLYSTMLPVNITRKYCYVGKSQWDIDPYVNAFIDDLKIFDVALTDEEVNKHFFMTK